MAVQYQNINLESSFHTNNDANNKFIMVSHECSLSLINSFDTNLPELRLKTKLFI